MKQTVITLILILFMIACSDKNEQDKKKLFDSKQHAKKEILGVQQTPPEPKTGTTIINEPENYNVEKITVTVSVARKKSKRLYWDNDQKPDVFGIIELPHSQVIPIPLKENSFTNTGESEKIILEKGDSVRVIIRDKDVTGYEEIANGVFAYNGRRFFTQKIGKATLTFSIKRKKNK